MAEHELLRQLRAANNQGSGASPQAPVTPQLPIPVPDDYTLFAGKQAGERKLVEVASGVSIPFRWCPPGTFTMGSPAAEQALAKKWELDAFHETEHRVTLTKGFWLAETEVTQGQWQAVMGTTLKEQAKKALEEDMLFQLGGKKQTYREFIGAKRTDDPARRIGVETDQVVMYWVNHGEAEDWCAGASRHAGVRGWRMALPSEAQWEYACRAGTSGMSYLGNFEIKGKLNAPGLDGIAWYGGNSSQGYSGGKGWGILLAGRRSSIREGWRAHDGWDRGGRTTGVCTTCWGTCGNGAGTGMAFMVAR